MDNTIPVASATERAEPMIGPVRVPKAAGVLASVLRAKILNGEFEEGLPLPPERALVEQTLLSRATVREALRELEQQGLVVTRPGRSGGSIVARPNRDDVSMSLDVFIQGWRLEMVTLQEVRHVIEPWCAEMAAARRTSEDVRRLHGHNEQMRRVINDLPAYLDQNVAWHMAVADASHNELITAFMHAVSRAIHRQTDSEEFNSPEVRQTAVRAHDRVTAAIEEGDAEAARRRMERHVAGFGEALLEDVRERDDSPAGSATL